VCGSDRAHYAEVAGEHAFDRYARDEQDGQLEAIGVRNAELEIECRKLKAQLKESRAALGASTSVSSVVEDGGDGRQPGLDAGNRITKEDCL